MENGINTSLSEKFVAVMGGQTRKPPHHRHFFSRCVAVSRILLVKNPPGCHSTGTRRWIGKVPARLLLAGTPRPSDCRTRVHQPGPIERVGSKRCRSTQKLFFYLFGSPGGMSLPDKRSNSRYMGGRHGRTIQYHVTVTRVCSIYHES